MSDELPTVVHTAEVQIGSVTLRVLHLSNNQRVIDAESVAAFVSALEDGSLLLTEADATELAAAMLL